MGDSNTLNVGEQVVPLATRLGLTGTMTLGIVSALVERSACDPGERRKFQHCRHHSDGCSHQPVIPGAPLFNMQGEVVGVNQSIRTNAVDQTTAQL
jgi:S1-C subfamily serine protease